MIKTIIHSYDKPWSDPQAPTIGKKPKKLTYCGGHLLLTKCDKVAFSFVLLCDSVILGALSPRRKIQYAKGT